MVPALGRKLKASPAQRDALLARTAPTLARDLPKLDPILKSFAGLGAALMADRHLFTDTAKIPSRTLVWLMIGASVLAALAAALALLAGAPRRRPAAAPVPAS